MISKEELIIQLLHTGKINLSETFILLNKTSNELFKGSKPMEGMELRALNKCLINKDNKL